MAGIKCTDKDKKRNTENGSTTQQQDQQQQNQVQTAEPSNETRARPALTFPSLAPLLANNIFPPSFYPSDQRASHSDDLQRLIKSYTEGDSDFLIQWFEQVNIDLEKIRLELDIVQKRLRDGDSSA